MKWDVLASLPLFMGMSQKELEQIMTQTRIDFKKVKEGTVIAKRNQHCGKLIIAIMGQFLCQTCSEDNSYKVEETITAPIILQSNGIFGKFQQFTHTITALTQANTISFDKVEVHKLICSSLIFRINLFGMLSTRLQKTERQLWERTCHPKGDTVREQNLDLLTQHLKTFFCQRCITPAGRKVFYIKQATLANILGQNRQQISAALRKLEKDRLVSNSRGKIEIHQLQYL